MAKYRIGLLVNGLETEYGIPILDGINQFCVKNDVDIYVFYTHFSSLPMLKTKKFSTQHLTISRLFNTDTLDAIIVTATSSSIFDNPKDYEKFLINLAPVPVVSIGVKLPNITSITIDNRTVFKRLVNHLIKKHECKKLLLITVSSFVYDIHERELGFFDAIKQNNIPKENIDVLRIPFQFGSVSNNIGRYIRNSKFDFDAAVCINDNMAIECSEFLESIGFSIPNDVKITGFDDIEIASLANPSITTINQCLHEQGYKGAEAAIKLAEKNKLENVIISTTIEYRKSCGCKRCHHENIRKEKYGDLKINLSSKSRNSIIETKYFKLREKVHQLQKCLQDMQTASYMEELKQNLFYHLLAMDIPECAIVLYDLPILCDNYLKAKIPNEASVFLVFNRHASTFSNFPAIRFNPNKEILPKQIISSTVHKRIVSSLYNSNYTYGYIVFTPTEFDFILYPTVANLISNGLASTYEFSMLQAKNDVLESISYTDDMTKVLNRRGLIIFGQDVINRTVIKNKTGLVIFGDMDGLKSINDTYGHDAGDRAIKAEISIMKQVFNKIDVIARFGGDEFIMIASEMTPEEFEHKKKQIDTASTLWNQKSGEPYTLSISLGSIVFDQTNADLSKLLTQADKKLYEEKKLHKEFQNIESVQYIPDEEK